MPLCERCRQPFDVHAEPCTCRLGAKCPSVGGGHNSLEHCIDALGEAVNMLKAARNGRHPEDD